MHLSKVVWCFIVIIALISGCAPRQDTDEKKIVIWHWMNDRKSAFEELAKRYTSQTNIPVKFKLFFPPDIYSQKVIAAARAGSLPEIFGILGEKKSLSSFIKAGHILDLTPVMKENANEWKDSFYPQTLQTTVFEKGNFYDVKPGIYGVPIDTTLMQFVYNRELFKRAGLDPDKPPQTFDEFITYAQTIKDKLGVDGFICGWGEGWLLNCLATEWAINIMDEQRFIQTLEGKIPYTDEKWIQVFSLFEKIKDSGILAADITTMINKEAEDAFSKGKAAFSFNGSWSVNVYKQLSPELDYAFFSLPKAANASFKIWGGAGSSFMVKAKSSNKDEAIKFLKWLTARKQQKFLIKNTNNLAAIKGCEQDLPPILSPLTDNLDRLTHPNIWPYNEDSRVIEVMNKGLQQTVMGVKTPQEVAQEVQQIKQRVGRR
ncbi:MAG: extracellular solute-binding protein [Candidatus Omnitrophota bacterium]|nr:MAG: extracellular solute-binding protein [Candidatus Omnitrophota bacterium]